MTFISSTHADPLDQHSNAGQLGRIFQTAVPEGFQPTGVSRQDYLKLIAANVDYFKRYQDDRGAIIDPVSKGERQYSTPAFAAAAGLLVKEAGREDLLAPATRAMTHALSALVEGHAADKHADFYIPLLIHAYRFLKVTAPAEEVRAWEEQFKRIRPEAIYRKDLRRMNWNVVSSSGELLRRHDGLVAEDQLAPQMDYMESCLEGHLERLTPLGLFNDPGAPMAYDAFTRLWLDDMLADDAYAGKHAEQIRSFLLQGGLSTLLLLSPSGEWPCGGRSGMHNWADLQITAICEIHAAHWKQQGRADIAGAFKRAAHLAFESAARWQRPSGELWIIKNRAEPEQRLAYERYSNHSQYNLLPMAMLAIAYDRADESIVERPAPAEVGGYVFDARETFHKVAAAAGGYYVLIDTQADPHYNATGLQRVHKAGVLFPALSDSAATERAYGSADIPKDAIAPGIEWLDTDGQWIGLADFSGKEDGLHVRSVTLESQTIEPDQVIFTLRYELADATQDIGTVTEQYRLNYEGVSLTTTADLEARRFRAQAPMLVNDGAASTEVSPSPTAVSIKQRGAMTTIALNKDSVSGPWNFTEPRVLTHNGYVIKGVIDLRSNTADFIMTLSQEGTD